MPNPWAPVGTRRNILTPVETRHNVFRPGQNYKKHRDPETSVD